MVERPMFPLGSVLLPGMVLPLHVFEERYRALVLDCLAGDRKFGVALIERGSEVGGGDIRAMAGCLAEIVESEEFDDGRWALVAVGTERIRVDGWLPDGPYPRAEVSPWPDPRLVDPAAAAEAHAANVAALRRVLAMAVELGVSADPMVELSDDPVAGTYQVALLAPIGAWDRQQVLLAPTIEDRLALVADLLADQELMIEARLEDG
ncbi:MAG: LON peptidase substrate-binding domain-containing protein [Acidimicrobiales bacterium]|nr:LON peptidase substrate-binding domain-containing protein [Acidimicrobiales bacterium]